MKKVLVLGLLAIFTVSYATAQNRTEKKSDVKAEQKQTKKVVKPAAASFETSNQKTAGKEAQQPKKADAAAIKEKNESMQSTCTKQDNNAQGCKKNEAETAPKASASKQKAEVGVPPTPKVKEGKKNTAKASNNNASK